MIDPNIESMDLSDIFKCVEKPSASFIKIKDLIIPLEGCKYCYYQISTKRSNQRFFRYDINCLEKSIKYRTYTLSIESEKCKGDEWDSSFEMLVYRKEQQDYLKEKLVKLKTIKRAGYIIVLYILD